MSIGYHYELQAYVCGRGCVQPSPFEGWATFAQIFNARPAECRYAVVRRVPLRRNPDTDPNTPLFHSGDPEGSFMVWDLFHDSVVKHQKHKFDTLLLRPPPPTWTGPTADGMIMKAMMLYDRP